MTSKSGTLKPSLRKAARGVNPIVENGRNHLGGERLPEEWDEVMREYVSAEELERRTVARKVAHPHVFGDPAEHIPHGIPSPEGSKSSRAEKPDSGPEKRLAAGPRQGFESEQNNTVSVMQHQPQPRQLPRQRPLFFNGNCNCCRGGDACACADEVQMLLTISGAAAGTHLISTTFDGPGNPGGDCGRTVTECSDFNGDWIFDRSFFPEACYWLASFTAAVTYECTARDAFGMEYPNIGHFNFEGFIQFYPDDGHYECELQIGGANNLNKYRSAKDLFFCNVGTPITLTRYYQGTFPALFCEWGSSITITPFV